MRSQGMLRTLAAQLNRTIEHLSTGKKLNHASEDPAGVQVVDQMHADIKAMTARMKQIEFNEKYLGAREGAEAAVSDLLVQLQSDVTSAANTGATTAAEREAYQRDANGVIQAIDFLAQTSQFNGGQILTGFTSSKLGLGAAYRPAAPGGTGEAPTSYSLADLLAGGALNLVTGDRDAAQLVITQAVKDITGDRAGIGAAMQAGEQERRTLQTQLENTEAARSGIEDADFAKETADLVREQTLQDANLYILQLVGEQKRAMVEGLLLKEPRA